VPATPQPTPPFASPFARPGSRGSAYFTRMVSEEVRALGGGHGTPGSATPPPGSTFGGPAGHTLTSRGSMILYRVADPFSTLVGGQGHGHANTQTGIIGHGPVTAEDGTLAHPPGSLLPPPPTMSHLNRSSVYSSSGDSIVSLSSDSKYPLPHLSMNGGSGAQTPERGLVAYAYDPDEDDGSDEDEYDWLHDPDPVPGGPVPLKGARPSTTASNASDSGGAGGGKSTRPPSSVATTSASPSPAPGKERPVQGYVYPRAQPSYPAVSARGMINITMLVVLVTSILCLFVLYPALMSKYDNGRLHNIAMNTRINRTGQASDEPFDPLSSSLSFTSSSTEVTDATTSTSSTTSTHTTSHTTETTETTSSTATDEPTPTPTVDPPIDPGTGAGGDTGLRRRAPNPIPAADTWQWWLRRSASPEANAGNVDVQTRGLRFDPELGVWMSDGLAEGDDSVEKDRYGRRSVRLRRSASPEADVQRRGLRFDPESGLWLNDGLAEGDEGVEKDRYGRRRDVRFAKRSVDVRALRRAQAEQEKGQEQEVLEHG